MLSVSINAGKLLPYQDYLLYKPSGCGKTKEYFQQLSETSSVNEGFEEQTQDNDSKTAVESDESDVLLIDDDVSAIFVDSAEYAGELASQHVPETVSEVQPVVDVISNLSADFASTVATKDSVLGSVAANDTVLSSAGEVPSVSSSHADNDDEQQMSAENRKRVSEFFTHSRLHHISTWGAEYKAYVTQLQGQVGRCYSINKYSLFSYDV